MHVSDRGVQLVSKGEAEPTEKEKAARSLKMVRRSQLCRGIPVSLKPRIESVKLKWNRAETVRSWRCTMELPSRYLLNMIPAKRVDFPICEKERDNHRQHVEMKVRRRQLPVMRTTRQQKLPVEEFCIRCIACKLKDAAPTACRDESLASFATACAIPHKSSVLAEKVVTQ